jgi:hypothetical protein
LKGIPVHEGHIIHHELLNDHVHSLFGIFSLHLIEGKEDFLVIGVELFLVCEEQDVELVDKSSAFEC